MLAFTSRSASPGLRAALSITVFAGCVAAMIGGGGCTLLVGDQLADKPSEGAGGGGGAGGSSSASQSSSVGQSSSATGGLMCKPDTANCDGFLLDGCETKLLTDPKNCGACKNACDSGEHCKEGKCE